MPYAPRVEDRTADYIMAAGQSTARMITGLGETVASGINTYAERRDEQDLMAGRLQSMGYMDNPEFSKKWTDAPYGKQKGMYADALLEYERKINREDEAYKLNQKKEFMEWSTNLDQKLQALPPDEQAQLPGMVQDYLTGATQGLQPDQNFMRKIFSMSGKGVNAFMQLVGKGMELFDMTNPRQAAPPQFQAAPGGGRVMLNPNNGTAQYIPDPEAQGTPGYTEVPAPAAGNVGLLRDGKGGIRVIPGGSTGGVPTRAQNPTDIWPPGGSAGLDEELPESSPEDAERELRINEALWGK